MLIFLLPFLISFNFFIYTFECNFFEFNGK